MHGIFRASVSRIVHEVCGASNSTMEYIMFPNDADTLRSLKADFFQLANFPNCVGAIDGTLIPINCNSMSGLGETAFICRKNVCALNIQVVADPNMRFLHINTCFPGASHDAYVLRSSGVPAIMEWNHCQKGVVTSGFRCLHSSGVGLRFSPQRCSKVIETCFRLHNTSIIEKVPLRQHGPVQIIN